ncbi:MAG TPA: hypothetical protein VFO19_21595 [Vicinamibacterales bacterium]|nr:hypothetical protein [Vicinamibacterales bacterium]
MSSNGIPDVSTLVAQLLALALLSMPVAAITWVVTHEEILREVREWCQARSRCAKGWWRRKAFYVVTCEYCFSHWVALPAALLTGFRLVYPGWLGLLIGWLALVWIANVYMTAFVRLRLDVKGERLEVAEREQRVGDQKRSSRAG